MSEETLLEEHQSVFRSLITQLSADMDLTKVALPTFVLEKRSLLESMTDTFAHPQLLDEAVSIDDDLERFLAVLKFYLSAWHTRPKGVKKPYNPILGETFRASRTISESSKVAFTCEQVSHHPPISALFASNKSKQWWINTSVHTRSQFLLISAAAHLEGKCTVCFLSRDNEIYESTSPSLYVSGFILGPMRLELGGDTYVTCSKTGYKAAISFRRKPSLYGQYNEVSGQVFDRDQNVTHTISGNWTSTFTITNNLTKEKSEFLDVQSLQNFPLEAFEVEGDPFQSRRLWADVTQALSDNNLNLATTHKVSLEERQRRGKKKREETNKEWRTKLFEKQEGNYVFRYKRDTPYPQNEALFTDEELTPAHHESSFGEDSIDNTVD
eukprot:c19911_g1_i3.p1 GENE.c19911_g1_i3~~c19911_g1_i3.p1  ORF type:complete len:393 (+),score=138.74 c19911_g1_i3:32-1180(+)